MLKFDASIFGGELPVGLGVVGIAVVSNAKRTFAEEQMVAIIREGDRDPVAAVAKRHGISEQTIYAWRKRFGALQASDVKRLRQLEAENARLKKLVAERDLEIEVMKEVAAKKW